MNPLSSSRFKTGQGVRSAQSDVDIVLRAYHARLQPHGVRARVDQRTSPMRLQLQSLVWSLNLLRMRSLRPLLLAKNRPKPGALDGF